MKSSGALIEVGVLTKPHGIRGEIGVLYYAESPDLLLSGNVYLQSGSRPPRKVEVTSMRMHQGMPLLRFADRPDRTAVEALRGQTVLVPDAVLPEPDDDEVYLHDMLGLAVLLESTGERIGTLDNVYFHGEQELWEIGTPEGKEILLPAVPEFVADINLDTEEIQITPPAGLLELYLGTPGEEQPDDADSSAAPR